ncbi:hypothetical protein LMH87_001291 [Akanthomyces muscarius]|uniref:MEI5 protein n=1 Tax=Akanthomyces muscarius TaxID=2231603 RepID=A0A9W8QIK6_AKAMU|nr:hypothetical protein LMH87_001291 [Akanthomyces muscarius]KAJ4156077.1 hypothetical protein LMH87_001291 [Akanthomyces muscarius]
MPSQRAKPPKEENGPSSNGLDPSLDAISLVSSSPVLKRLLQIDIENEQLLKRNSDLEVANRTNLASIAEQRNKWDADRNIVLRELQDQKDKVQSLRSAETKAETLDRQIKDQEKSILTQVETIKKKSAEISRQQTLYEKTKEELDKEKSSRTALSSSLQTAKQDMARNKLELTNANASLATLQSFVVPLQPVADAKAQIKVALSDIFHRFLDLYKAELTIDVAADAAPVAAIEKLGIPLPASNSSAAKQMRVVAALAVTGEALAKYVFQQALVDPDGNLHRVLRHLAVEDAEHEAYVRAVLLRLFKELPDNKQRAMQSGGIASAVGDIVDALEPWAPRARLEEKVRLLCEGAAEAWSLALEIENKIEAVFLFQVPEDWRAVPLEKKSTTIGAASISQNSKSQANTPKQPAGTAQTQQYNPASLSKKQVAKVVWPVFMALTPDEDDPEIVCCGYVLTKAQIREADEEVADEESTYKMARQGLRRQSTTQKKRRNSLAVS